MICIFCDKENEAVSIEHIVSESFGNEDYTIERGKVCDACNAKFSKFEQLALSNSIFVMERARFGVKTKKGRTAKGTVGELKIEGSPDFEDQTVVLKGLDQTNVLNVDPVTNTFQVLVKSFDKS